MQLTDLLSPGVRRSLLLIAGFLASIPAQAQIIPDSSLPNNSVITPNGSTLNITGGTAVGANLFHSFQQFSVLTGQTAYFNNGLNVQNILSRVTGGQISTIEGAIRANGRANLFLINPNGIIFGPNAQLRLGGSFVGSTANSIKFADGSEFSAINPQTPSLLAINVPIGLQMGSNPGSIINQSQATSLIPLPPLNLPFAVPINTNNTGLQVFPGQSLALIGGDISLDNGNLTALQGQILLGSVKSPGFVGITFTPLGLSFNYDNIQNFGNVSLSRDSTLNVSGLSGGKVEIRGGNVTLSNSQIYDLNLGNSGGGGIEINAQQLLIQDGTKLSTLALADGKGGEIKLGATDSIEISGVGFDNYQQFLVQYLASGTADVFNPSIVLVTGTYGKGKAGDIQIATPNLQLREGAIVASTTFGAGNAGNLSIRTNVMEMVGAGINTGTLQGSSGKGGNIDISTQRLTVRDGSGLGSTSNSIGDGGNITINAAESVELLRSPPGAVIQTLIGTNTLDPNGVGRAGDITIDTKRLTVADGTGISSASGGIIGATLLPNVGGQGGNLIIKASESVQVTGVSGVLANGGQVASYLATGTAGANRGGDIYITTPILSVRDGGLISAASLNTGIAGDITIDANRAEVIGSGVNGRLISKIEASAGNLFIFSNPNATGKAGSVNLNAAHMSVRDGARVTVSASGTGSAGNINIVGKEIILDNKASINASTSSGEEGNINLNANDIILRRGSQISTNAENTTGGNIRINTDNLVAVPRENSDITANAQKGTGGSVSITTQGIFGFGFPTQLTPLSDITASSDLGTEFNGTVQRNIQGTDINRGLVQLPETVVDSTKQIATGCSAVGQNSFTITGRGGLPPSPREVLNAPDGWIDWRISSKAEGTQESRESFNQSLNTNSPSTIVEATGWIVADDGTVELVTQAPIKAFDNSNLSRANCLN